MTIAKRPSEWDGMEWQYPCFYLAVKRNSEIPKSILPYAAGSMTCGPDREFLEQPVGQISWAAVINRARLVLLAQCPLCPDSDQMLPAQRNDAMCQRSRHRNGFKRASAFSWPPCRRRVIARYRFRYPVAKFGICWLNMYASGRNVRPGFCRR